MRQIVRTGALVLLVLTSACSKKEGADGTPAASASAAAKEAPFPVMTAADWKPVIQEAIAADKFFTTGVLRTGGKYIELSTKGFESGDMNAAHRNWVFGHLLSWYAAELSVGLVDAKTVANNRSLLLQNRATQVANSNLTIEALRASFEAMNSQLELVGRPKCKSLSVE